MTEQQLAIAYANIPEESARPHPTCPFCGAQDNPLLDVDGWVAYFGSSPEGGRVIHEWFCFSCWTGWEVTYIPTLLTIKESNEQRV
jgi:hypothetical protein